MGIEGRLQTGSYTNKNGDKVYMTDVVANRVEFLEWGDRDSRGMNQSQESGFGQNQSQGPDSSQEGYSIPAGFEAISDDDIPF